MPIPLRSLCALFAAALLVPCATRAADQELKPRFRVGYRIVEAPLGDAKITIAVWYPTAAEPRTVRYGETASRGEVAPDAAVKDGAWPLLLHSHGFGGSGILHAAQTAALAAQGWVVAAPDHGDAVTTARIRGVATGSLQDMLDHLRKQPFTPEAYAYRPREAAAVLSYMLDQAPAFKIAPDKVAALGHSMGGYSVTKTALSDARIKAVVSYSMGELNWLYAKQRYFDAETIAGLKRPLLLLYGTKEKEANPRGTYAQFCYEHAAAPACLAGIPGGNHFVYCDRALARGSGATAEQEALILKQTMAFLQKHVEGKDVRLEAEASK